MREANTDPAPRKGVFLKPTSRTENTASNSSDATHTSIKYKLELCAYRFQHLTKEHLHDAQQNCTPSNINSDTTSTWMWIDTQMKSPYACTYTCVYIQEEVLFRCPPINFNVLFYCHSVNCNVLFYGLSVNFTILLYCPSITFIWPT